MAITLRGTYTEWKSEQVNIFWGEIAPCSHVLHIYDNDSRFLDLLGGFVGTGVSAGDCTIVIATVAHLQELDKRLRAHGINVAHAISDEQYIPLNAEEVLSQFMINDWPDDDLFLQTVSSLFEKARKRQRHIRAFGEMVAILWEKKQYAATVRLEYLWEQYCHEQPFSLFCAYPKPGFTSDLNHSIEEICQHHAKVVTNAYHPSNILYKDNSAGMAV